jgi:hypothetical protein
METTKNKMPDFAEKFCKNLGRYLDTKIYFFGSIQRIDYFPNSSDIDVDIFTDNENSTILKLQNFLGVKRYEFKKIVYRLHKTKMVVHGHKVKYQDEENNFMIEIVIYNEKIKHAILEEHLSKIELPFYISFLLVIVKTLYYKFNILPKPVYYFFKKLIMNYMVEGVDTEFINTEII